MVVKVDDLELHRRLGSVGRDPRWAVAWKFPPTTAVTRLEKVMWNVGKFGDMRPYAVLAPVEVGGVQDRPCHPPQRGGPRAQGPEGGRGCDRPAGRGRDPAGGLPGAARGRAQASSAAATPAGALPVLQHHDVKPQDGVFTKCPNPVCPARLWQLLKHFVSRGAMDIDGLGEKQVALLQEHGLVKTAGDFYRLTAEELVGLEGFAELSVKNLLAAIETSKERPFARVLFALGIEEVGEVTGRNLAQRFRDIDALLNATPEQIAETPGVGEKMAASISAQLKDERMRALIEDLRGAGLRFAEEGPAPSEGPLAGRTLVLTGTLPEWSREQATERIMAAGGRVTSSVSKNTDYLVAGESAGSKLAKAERLEVAVIDEGGLRGLLGQ